MKRILSACIVLLISSFWIGCDDGGGGGGQGRTTIGGGGTSSSVLLVTDAVGNKVLSSSLDSNGNVTSAGTGDTGAQPTAIAVASGKFVLTANTGTTTVSSFTISTTGTLTSNGTGNFGAGLGPSTIAVAPTGGLVIIGNSTSSNLSVETIDANGILTQVNTFGLAASPRAIIFAGNILYVSTNGQIAGYQVISNVITPLPSASIIGTNFSALAFSGGFLYAADDSANIVRRFSVNSTTGALTLTGIDAAVDTTPVAMTFDNTGNFLYVVNKGSHTVSVFTKDSTTGALTSAQGSITTGGNLPTAVAFDSTDSLLFVPNSGSGTVAVFKVNTTTGVLTSAGTPVTMGTQPTGVAVATP